MESAVSEGWAAKNAGGREDEARISGARAFRAYNGLPQQKLECLNADGRMHLWVLMSKAESLFAALSNSTADINHAIADERMIIRLAKPFREANTVYWEAINADMAKMQRRQAAVARVESAAAAAKRRSEYERRQAMLTTLHGHGTRTQAHALVTMDSKTPAPRVRPSTVRASSPGRPQMCARPNVAATTLRPVEPDTPALAQRQGIQGTVQVIVALNAQSEVVGTRIQTSPSAVLNDAALAAARASTFQTEIRDCKPIAAEFIFSVDFTSQ